MVQDGGGRSGSGSGTPHPIFTPLVIALAVLVAAFAVSTLLERAIPGGTVMPQSGTVRLEVLNGCGKDEVAAQAAKILRQAGFDVVRIGNADRFNYGSVVVIDRVGKKAHAEKAASLLRTDCVVVQRKKDCPYDATVVIGHAFSASAFNK